MKFKLKDHIDHNECGIMAVLKLLMISNYLLLRLNDGNMKIKETVCKFFNINKLIKETHSSMESIFEIHCTFKKVRKIPRNLPL